MGYFVRYMGKVRGPFQHDDVLRMVRRGQLTALHEVSADGVGWRPASEVAELGVHESPPRPADIPTHSDGERSRDAAASVRARMRQPGQVTATNDRSVLTSIWLMTGVALVSMYVVPIFSMGDRTMWMWDLLGDYGGATPIVGIWLLLMALSGLPMALVGYLAPPRGASITVLAMGGVGVLLFLSVVISADSVDLFNGGNGGMGEFSRMGSASDILGLASVAAICLMLTGNNLVLRHPAARVGQLLGGISASAAIALSLVNLILAIVASVDLPITAGVRTVGIVGNVVIGMTFIAAGILVVVNMARNSANPRLSSLANLLALVGCVVSILLPPLLFVLVVGPDTTASTSLGLLFLRIVVYAVSPFVMIGTGLYYLISTTIDRRG